VAVKGFHGQKTGKGWYLYEGGSRLPSAHPAADALVDAYRKDLLAGDDDAFAKT
jgi:3-hydroxyacyl-CoA dehydrogenase